MPENDYFSFYSKNNCSSSISGQEVTLTTLNAWQSVNAGTTQDISCTFRILLHGTDPSARPNSYTVL